jgi:hypothetical protein
LPARSKTGRPWGSVISVHSSLHLRPFRVQPHKGFKRREVRQQMGNSGPISTFHELWPDVTNRRQGVESLRARECVELCHCRFRKLHPLDRFAIAGESEHD